MKIKWQIDKNDIKRIKIFVAKHQNPFVKSVIERNVIRKDIVVDRNSILKYIMMCLITSQQQSGPTSKVGIFLQLNPFPLTYETVSKSKNVENYIKQIMLANELNRYINRIPKYFSFIFNHLEASNWEMFHNIEKKLNGHNNRETEREIADEIDETFKGFGPKQSRNFLQALGLTKYEVPIDSRITTWLNDFGFPIRLSSIALQDKEYYHFVLDGFQLLCQKADIFPCILDAAIFSSYDNELWTEHNTIY
jgi:hypothetical protein